MVLTFSWETKLDEISTNQGDAASAAWPPTASSSGTMAENGSCCRESYPKERNRVSRQGMLELLDSTKGDMLDSTSSFFRFDRK